jgi:hypothetical protein
MKLLIGFAVGYFVATTPIGQELLPTVQAYSVQFLEWTTNLIRSI